MVAALKTSGDWRGAAGGVMLGLGLAALLLAKRRAWLTPRIGA